MEGRVTAAVRADRYLKSIAISWGCNEKTDAEALYAGVESVSNKFRQR